VDELPREQFMQWMSQLRKLERHRMLVLFQSLCASPDAFVVFSRLCLLLQEPEAVAAIFIIPNTLFLIAETISSSLSFVNTNT